MKKLVIFFLIIFSFLTFKSESVYAWPNLPDIHIDIPNINLPTSIPTPTPTLKMFKIDPGIFKISIVPIETTPTTTPSLTPTVTSQPTVEPTKEETIIIATNTPSPTLAAIVSPTAKPENKKVLSNKDMIYMGVAGLLSIIILVQAWPKIKQFLHDKTA